jgi:hypothetical protein
MHPGERPGQGAFSGRRGLVLDGFRPTRACAREGQPASSASRSSRQHGLSDTDIRKRAKANGWTRDLSGAGAARRRRVDDGGLGRPRTC